MTRPALIALTLALCACGGPTAEAAPAAEPVAPPSEPASVPADGPTELVVKVGEEVRLVIDSNPTTGYRWGQIDPAPDASVLEATGHDFIGPEPPPPGQPPRVGAGGQEVWRYKALKVGETVVTLGYARPWEKGAPGLVKSWRVKVQAP